VWAGTFVCPGHRGPALRPTPKLIQRAKTDRQDSPFPAVYLFAVVVDNPNHGPDLSIVDEEEEDVVWI